jgi:transposase-like protein
MKQKYTEAFIEQAVVKLLSRGDHTVREVALELNVNYHTAKNWIKRGTSDRAVSAPKKEKRPVDWTTEEQLLALIETHALSGEAKHAWCREKGLFSHHLTSWKAAFYAVGKATPGSRELRTLKDENQQLRRDLVRKEKALSEAAALLILQKKFRALWEDEAK